MDATLKAGEGTDQMAVEERVVSREELLQRAGSLVPALKARASETEDLRRIPEATIDDLKDSGLLRIAAPPCYGGYEHDIDLMFQVAMELARGCGSAGWCYAVWSIHNWMLGHWPQEAQDEYFQYGPETLSGSAFAPSGKLEPVDGGFRLSGRWDFSSGCDAGNWEMLTAMSPQGPMMALVPRGEYEILDTWFASGLMGTGSKDVVVDGAFVPAHRLVPFLTMGIGSPAFGLHGRPSYRLPALALLPATLASAATGMARGALDDFTARLAGKTGHGKSAESVALQLRLAESGAEVDSAQRTINARVAEFLDLGRQDVMPSELQQATYRRDIAYAARLGVQATNRLFDASGGHALQRTVPIQRFHRDVHAAAHHVALNWDSIAEGYGRAALGLPPLTSNRQ